MNAGVWRYLGWVSTLKKNGGTDFFVGIFRRPWDMSGRPKMYNNFKPVRRYLALSCNYLTVAALALVLI